MSGTLDASANDFALTAEEQQRLREAPSPLFIEHARNVLRGRHARSNRLLGWFGLDGPLGQLRIVHDGVLVHLVTNAPDGFDAFLDAHLGFEPRYEPSARVAGAVAEVFAGKRRGDSVTYLDGLSGFQQSILKTAARIPRGEVRPYGWVAREAGSPGAVRAAGTALGHNPAPFVVPCHRVVRSDWRLGQYSAAGGTETKARVLAWEGFNVDLLEKLARPSEAGYVGDSGTRRFHLPVCRVALDIPAGRRAEFRRAGDAVAAAFEPCVSCRPAGA